MPSKFRKILAAATCILTMATMSVSAAETQLTFPTYAWTDPLDGAYLGALVSDFESKHSDVKVNRIPIPFSNMADKLFLDVTSGKAPDFVTLFDVDVSKYIQEGLLEPLDSYLEQAGVNPNEFADAAHQGMKDGHVFAVVNSINPRALFYNSDIFNKLGLKVPQTEEQFLDVARKIKSSGLVRFPLVQYAKPGDANTLFIRLAPILAAFDAAIYRDGKPAADDPRVVRAFAFYKKLYDEGLIPRGMDAQLAEKMFAEGKAAMILNGSYFAGVVKETNGEVFKSLRSTSLHFEGDRATSVSVFIGVPKGAPHKELAAQMLMLMLTKEWQNRVVTDVAAIPARKDMMPADFVHDNQWFSAFAEAGPKAHSYAPEGAEQIAPEVVKATATKVEAMLFQGVSPEQTAKELQESLLALKP
ncbi:sugar ABC transporter substrate-binding protein [Mesorhizobium sp.]|uniref:ABC transporter substrate-binding protein n=1 Tax=Mesorhizobium sp. TaxID=1871066 RepID=UPI00257A2DB8|nr:sugar ABC transporter substrate-binding protein [Mesorhizobium sp.]